MSGSNAFHKAILVKIDSAKCCGHGRCVDLAPAIFGMDEEGSGVVRRQPVPSEEASAMKAIAGCPEQAISEITEGTTS